MANKVPLKAQIESEVVARVSVLSAGERRYSATSGMRVPTGEAEAEAVASIGRDLDIVSSRLQQGPFRVVEGKGARLAVVKLAVGTPAQAVGSPIAHAQARSVPLRMAQRVKSAEVEREARERRTKTTTKIKIEATCCVIGRVWRSRAGRLAGWTLTGGVVS